MEITKQYIASDSSIANPTNNVRVIIWPASGCCAIELKAEEIDLPWPKAGIIQPIPVVIPAIIMETIAIKVELSILIIFSFGFLSCSCNIYRCQNGENIGLNETGY